MTEMVRIGCKMPSGVVLNLTSYELVNKEHSVIRRVGDEKATVTLKGNAFRQDRPDLSINGYVFTQVPKAFWDEWKASHADSSLLADGFIIEAKSEDHSKGIAKERRDERGMFPRLVEKDERVRGLKVKTFDPKDEAA